jgi:hypothetical protein
MLERSCEAHIESRPKLVSNLGTLLSKGNRKKTRPLVRNSCKIFKGEGVDAMRS